MGREGVKLFHAKGWRVGAVDRNDDGLAELSLELGAGLWTRVVDVGQSRAGFGARRLLHRQRRRRSGHDVEQRGHREGGWFEDVPYEAAMRVVDVNFKAVLTGA